MSDSGLRYATLDVFTSTKFAGNPLAIVELPSSANLSQEQKQTIAREFNYSETVFLHTRQEHTQGHQWKIDIFTLDQELPFAGHPTIGTACHVLSLVAKESPLGSETIKGSFITKAGKIHLEYDHLKQVAKAAIPHNVHAHEGTFSHEQVLEVQNGLRGSNVSLERSPVVSIVKGMTFILVDLKNEETLGRCKPTANHAKVQLDQEWEPSFVGMYFYIHLPDSEDGTRNLRTRMIEGALEDPATGSAACTLASFLSQQRDGPGTTTRYKITQGVEMGRKSDIGVEVTLGEHREVVSVELIGAAAQIMQGNLSL